MKAKKIYFYIALFCIHVLIAFIAFLFFRLHPYNVIAANYGDGLKNIFTLTTYIKEPITADGILKYNHFQYPFGDYVYYADNTPLFAIPFRWFCHHICDLSAYTIIVFYNVIILNIVLCGMLVFYVFRRFLGQDVIPFILAVVLPWANMQLLRIFVGHYAFSFTSLILIAIVLTMQWHKHRDNRRKQMLVGIGMVLLSYCSFLAQGYFLAIITLFIAAMLFFYGVWQRHTAAGRYNMIAGVVYAATAVVFTVASIAFTDPYLSLRREGAHGYDWIFQKTSFTSLFTHYPFHTVFFPVSYGRIVMEPEQASYLGNIGLFTFLIVGIAMLVSATFRARIISVQREFFSDPLKAAIFVGGVVLLFVAFGENYYTSTEPDAAFHFTNLLNPLFYVHIFTNRVEQFRSLERFVWPFFFTFNIWTAYTLAAVYKHYGRNIRIAIIAGALFLGGAEVQNFVDACQSYIKQDNPLAAQHIIEVMPRHIDGKRYQAILPIPYYIVGSEDYEHTVDDNNNWSAATYELSIGLDLPLMSCKMSRTPLAHNTMLLSFVANDSLPAELANRFNSKPVLVAVNRHILRDPGYNAASFNNPRVEEYYHKANQFADRNHLAAIDSLDDVVYYEWYPPKHK